jgi:hypothetical protein
MKILFGILLSFLLVAFTGCSGDVVGDDNADVVTISKAQYDSLCYEAGRVEGLEDRIENQENFIANLKKSPEFYLIIADAELNAAENGNQTFGSFTDFFVPILYDGYTRGGVPKEEIKKRIDRAIELAQKGKFISSYQADLYNAGGEEAIHQYIYEWSGGILDL